MSFKLNVLLEDIIKFDSFQVHRMETYNVLCRNYWVKSYNFIIIKSYNIKSYKKIL